MADTHIWLGLYPAFGWHYPDNWLPTDVPVYGDLAFIYGNAPGTKNVIVAGLAAATEVHLGGNGGLVTMEIRPGALFGADREYVGSAAPGIFPASGDGAVVQTGGTHQVVNDLYLGCLGGYPGGTGSYELSGTGVLSAGNEHVGYEMTGTFTQNGGTNTVTGGLITGEASLTWGTYTMNAGSLQAEWETIGHEGTGWFMQTGGTHTVADNLWLGSREFSDAIYQLGGAGVLSAANEHVGYEGAATFTHSAGQNTVTGELCIGRKSTGWGHYTLSGTGVLSAANEHVGYEGTGTFTQTGSTHTVAGSLVVGNELGSSGTYILDAGYLQAGSEAIGEGGTGLFTQVGGRHIVMASLYLGSRSGASGTYELSGTGVLSAANVHIGDGGTGTFTQAGGMNAVTGSLYLGEHSTGQGTYELSGGALGVAGQIYVGASGTGTFTFYGGTLLAGSVSVGPGGTFTFHGGTLQVGTFTGHLVNNGGTVAPGGSVGITTVDGGYTQVGSGTLAVELAGAAPGTQHDLLVVNGAAELAGTLTLRILPGFNPAGLSFTILTSNDGVTGQFSSLVGPIGDVIYNPDSVAVTVLVGDANSDRCVDGLDYLIWSGNYNKTGMFWVQGDFNGDQLVDGLDYIAWSNNYWAGCPGSPGAVPEPAALSLLALASLALLRRRSAQVIRRRRVTRS